MSSIFLSHSSMDKPFVRKLASDLRRNGIYAWVDEAEIKVGDSLIEKIEEGIALTDFLGVVLSNNSVKSEWVTREVRIALNQEISGKRVKVLPLLLEKVDMPLFLVDKKYADFTTEDKYSSTLSALIESLAQLPDDINKTQISISELRFYQQQLEELRAQFDVTRGEKRRLLERLEKERKNIPESLRLSIEEANRIQPEFADVDRLYAFNVAGISVTAGYVLHCLRKEKIKGGAHQITVLCELYNATDELSLLLEATLLRVQALAQKGKEVVVL